MTRVALALAMLLWASTAQATNFYVAKTGSNSNTCTQAQSISTPKLTLTGASGGFSCLSAGDTLFVRVGTYVEMLRGTTGTDTPPNGIDSNSYTRVVAYNGESVTVDGGSNFYVLHLGFGAFNSFIEFDGINFDGDSVQFAVVKLDCNDDDGASNSAAVENAHHIRIKNATLTAPGTADHMNVLVVGQATNCQGGNEFINLTVVNSGGTGFDHAFYLQTDGNVIQGCNISNSSGGGVHVYNGSGHSLVGNRIVGNIIRDPRSNITGDGRRWGVIVYTSADSTLLANNIIYGYTNTDANNHDGILVGGGANGTLIYNNTIEDNDGNGIRIGDDADTASNTIVRNNIARNSGLSNYLNYSSSTTPSGGSPANNIFTNGSDPGYVNGAGHNFRLSAASGPAYNAGFTVADVTTDFDLNARPQSTAYDIGAFEFTSFTPPQDIVDATGDTIFTLTFTGTSGNNLTTLGLLKQTGATGDAVISSAGRARSNSSGRVRYYNPVATLSADYDLTADFRVLSLIASSIYRVEVRMQAALSTEYSCGYDVSALQWFIEKWDNDTRTRFVFSSATLSTSTTYAVRCEVRTLSASRVAIGMEVDGTPTLYHEDTSSPILTAGFGGLAWYTDGAADDNVTGIHIDNVVVIDVDTAPAAGSARMPVGIRVRTP